MHHTRFYLLALRKDLVKNPPKKINLSLDESLIHKTSAHVLNSFEEFGLLMPSEDVRDLNPRQARSGKPGVLCETMSRLAIVEDYGKPKIGMAPVVSPTPSTTPTPGSCRHRPPPPGLAG